MVECDYCDVVAALNKLGRDPAEAFRLFGQRGFDAWQIVKACGVKKYVFQPSGKVVWIVVGEEGEYLLYPVVGYCQCDDFYYQVMEGEAEVCQHLIAQRLASNLGVYDVVEESDESFLRRMDEWRKLL